MLRSQSNLRSAGQFVARRVLTEANKPDRQIEISIARPRRVGREEWECPISIKGLNPSPTTQSAHGVDSLQALLLGIRWAYLLLKQSGLEFAWLGDSELSPTGIPQFVPDDFGKEFERRVELAIEREKRRFRKFRSKVLRRHFVESTKGQSKRKSAPRT